MEYTITMVPFHVSTYKWLFSSDDAYSDLGPV
jgi:hypothetical protein